MRRTLFWKLMKRIAKPLAFALAINFTLASDALVGYTNAVAQAHATPARTFATIPPATPPLSPPKTAFLPSVPQLLNNIAPSVTAPAPVTVEATSPAGAQVTLTGQVQDPDCNALTVTWNADGGAAERIETVGHAQQSTAVTFTHLYSVGVHPVTVTVSDGTADPVTASTTVTVRDTAPPQVTAGLALGELWPPNHQFVDVGLTVTGSDTIGSTTFSVTVYSDEDDVEATGSGHFSPDVIAFPILSTGLNPLFLRSERKGNGDGRVYLIVVTARDASGNSTFTCQTAVVPKSQSKHDKDAIETLAAQVRATCTATGSTLTPYIVGDGPLIPSGGNPSVMALGVTPANASVAASTSQQYSAVRLMSNNTTQTVTGAVTWSTATHAVATVNAAGLLQAVASGTTTVSASSGGFTGSTSVSVTTGGLRSIAIFPESLKFFPGTSQALSAIGTYADGTTQDLTHQVTWSTSSSAVGTVDLSGLATAANQGTTTLVATNSGVSGSATMDVLPLQILSISVTPAQSEILVGGFAQLRALATYNNCTSADITDTAVWTSSAVGFATVSHGLVQGASGGQSTITASQSGVSGTATVNVSGRQLISISVAPHDSSLPQGTHCGCRATGNFSDGTSEDITATATWSSSNTTSLPITTTGIATAASPGASTVTAARDGVSGTSLLTVTPPALVGIAVTPARTSVTPGQSANYVATGTYSNGSMQNLTASVTWTSSNTAVGTVNASGLATGVIPGQAGITATLGTISASGTLDVIPSPLVSIAVTPVEVSMAAGLTQSYTATGSFADGTSADITSSVTWTTDANAVASISAAGLATARTQGATTVRATRDGIQGTAILRVVPPRLVALAVTPPAASIGVGSTLAYQAIGTYSDGTTRDLTSAVGWTSALPSVASIGSSGQATGVSAGTTTILAATADQIATASLVVTAPTSVAITVTPQNASIPIGGTLGYAAAARLSDGTTQDITAQATWTSSRPAFAMVSAAGVASGIAAGTTTITASKGGLAATATLTVTPPGLVSISVTPADSTVVVGLVVPFVATGTYSDGTTQNISAAVTWSTTTSGIATIDAVGRATGRAPGSVVVQAVQGGVSGQATLIVLPPSLVSISVSPAASTRRPGQTQQYSAEGTYSDGSTQELSASVIWSSGAPFVAAISPAGLATATLAGSTRILATKDGLSGSAMLTVLASDLLALSIDPPDKSIFSGAMQQYTATGTFADGRTQDLTNVVAWSSSDTGLAPIDAAGLVKAGKEGTAVIRAETAGIAATANLTVICPELLSLTLSPANLTLTPGNAVQLNAQGGYSNGASYTAAKDLIHYWPGDGNANDVVGGLNGTFVNGATADAPGIHGQAFRFDGVSRFVEIPDDPSINFATNAAMSVEMWCYRAGTGPVMHMLGKRAGLNGIEYQMAFDPTHGIAWVSSHVQPPLNQWFHLVGTYDNQNWKLFMDGKLIGDSGNAPFPFGQINSAPLMIGKSDIFEVWDGLIDEVKMYRRAITPAEAQASFEAQSSCIKPLRITWTSSDPSIITVDANGLLTAVGPGTATITATSDSGLTATQQVTVVGSTEIASVAISPESTTVSQYDSVSFTLTGTKTDGTTVDLTSTAAWTSGDPSVSTVGASGLASTLRQGTTTITGTKDGLSAVAVLTVGPPRLASIAVSPATSTLAAGQSQILRATGTYVGGSTADLTQAYAPGLVLWCPGDGNANDIAGNAPGILVNGAVATAPGKVGQAFRFNGTNQYAQLPDDRRFAFSGSDFTMETWVNLDAVKPGSKFNLPNVFMAQDEGGGPTNKWVFFLADDGLWFLTSVISSFGGFAFVGGAPFTPTTGQWYHVAVVRTGSTFTFYVNGSPVGSGTTNFPVTDVSAPLLLGQAEGAGFLNGRLDEVGIWNRALSATELQRVMRSGKYLLEWTSSDPASAAANPGGVVSGVAPGGATITASTLSGLSGTAQVTVTPPVPVGITVTPSGNALSLGRSLQYTATENFSDGATQDVSAQVFWSTSDPSIAQISAAGLASGISPGAVTIIAQLGGITGSTGLTVTPPGTASIAISPSSTVLPAGRSQQYTAIETLSDGSSRDATADVAWSTSNPSVATINASGLATGVAAGSVTVAASKNGVTGTASLTVTGATPVAIVVSPASSTLDAGRTLQYAAVESYSDGTSRDVTTQVVWSVTNAPVASVGATGLVTALAIGQTNISASKDGLSGSTTLSIVAAQLVSIAVSPDGATRASGQTLSYTAQGLFSDGSVVDLTSSVTWKSSDPSVASIDASGLAHALTAGQTSITASMSGIAGATTLTVTGPALTAIAVSPGGAAVPRGLTQQFTATGTYSDGSTQDLTSLVTWTSSAPAVATINASGLASALTLGSTQITASKSGGSVTVTLTVTAPIVRQIAVTPADASTAAGLRLPYSARGIFSDGTSQDVTATATWTSSDSSIATIAPGGQASALRIGRTTISATAQGVTGSTSLTVTAALLVSIAVSPAVATLPSGQAQTYTATGTYSDGSHLALSSGVLWTSSDPSIASVDAAGVVRALTAGHTSTSASVGSVTGTAALSVTGPYLVSIAVTPSGASVQAGFTRQYAATGTYSNGSTQDITPVVGWSSSQSSIATVSGSGLATGLLAGQTQIGAAKDGVSAGVVLTVTPPFLQSLVVTPANATIAAGLKISYKVKGIYSDGTTQDITASVAWSSSDASIAAISAAGQATGLRPGLTTISAVSQGVTGSTLLTVTAPLLTSLAVSPGSFSATSGQTVQFTARGTYSDGSSQDLTSSMTWTSSDPSVGSVNAAGLAKALTGGQTTISGSISGVSIAATFFVSGATLVNITVSPANDIQPAGFTRQFTATGNYSDGSMQDITAVVLWTSSRPANAAISGTGLATAVSPGFTIITASKDGASTSTAFNVSPPVLRSLTITPGQATAQVGQNQGFTAIGTYSDGVLRDATLQVAWTSSAPSIASVNGSGVATAIAAGTATLSASKDGLSASATFQVIRVVTIAVSPASAQTIVGRSQQFSASGTFSDGTVSNITAIAAWSSSNPAIAQILGPGLASGVSAGSATITASRDGASGGASLTVTPPPPPPTVAITSPAQDSTITEALNIVGLASAAYVLDVAERGSADFRTLMISPNPVSGGTLGRFDPSILINGIYTVRLTATDALGQTASTSIQLIVDGQVKLGLFSVGFDDLTIPVQGIPITMTRIYDSRLRNVSDFGIGWRLALSSMSVRTNTEPGNQGWDFVPNNDFFHTNSLVRTGNHYVTITFGDGRTETFDYTPFQEKQFESGIWTAPVLQGRSTTTSTLVSLGDSEVILSDGYLFDLSAHVYDPQDYRLTTTDGTAFVINLRQGLREIHDANGNVVTISPAGIIHSSGVSVPFVRDTANRITSITDPDGKSLTYTYDTVGHLTAAKDREQKSTTYTYGSQDQLATIVDPVGRRTLRNEYDPDGRVIATIDAQGNRIEYTHSPDTRQEIARDRNGNQTVYEYDARGNVVTTTDAQGHRTSSTYDAFDNETSRSDALNHTTTSSYDDKRNLLSRSIVVGGVTQTTNYTYNALGRVLTSTDSLQRITTNIYDASGNLLTTEDPLHHVTTNTFVQGRLISAVDVLGTRTEFDYDIPGNVIEQRVKSSTGTLLRKTTSTYDRNNRLLTQTVWKDDGSGSFVAYATTTTVYDGNGRVTEVRDALGHSSFTTYTAAGQRETVIDKNGNVTRYTYDNRGQLQKMEFPAIGGAPPTEDIGYDPQGNRTTFKDRNGNTTTTVYDTVNRPFMVLNPDASFRLTSYDAAGRVQSVTDERNFTTSYGYDETGRRTTLTDALGKVTHFEYDAAGQLSASVDALGHRTQFKYDAAGRQTRVTFHDGSFRQTDFDALGRRSAEEDEAGARTEFVYSTTGELLEIHQPDPSNAAELSTITRYEYDSLGRKVRQIDALGRITRFDYTVRGELLSRARPLGEQEAFTYDFQGNLQSRTDAMNRVTSFGYNALNLLSSKSFPDGSSQAFAYFPGGQRSTWARGSEVILFGLDSRNRLSSQTNPDGSALAWTYDATGNRTGVTVSQSGDLSQQIAYTWTARNELFQVYRSGQLWGTYAYDDAGNRQSLAYANGTSQTLSYNSKNQLLSIQNKTGSGGVISSYVYMLDARGMRQGVVEESGRTVAYAYDALKRLVQEQIVELSGTTTIGYALDRVGNRLQKQIIATSTQTTTYGYNDDDQLLTENGPDGLISYGYNPNGETVQKIAAGVGSITYSWDFEGRMVGALTPSESIAYSYDLDGIRSAKSVNSAVTRFVVDKNRDYAQVLEERDGLGTIQVGYVYGDDLLTQERSSGVSFFHTDGQLSTRQLTDVGAVTTDRYTYDAYGVELSAVGTTTNLYRYTGEQLDASIGCYYLRARYFNQRVGRFLSQDPSQGDTSDPGTLHRYLYAGNNPVSNVDPSGLFETALGALSVGAIISIVASASAAALYKGLQAAQQKKSTWEVIGIAGLHFLITASIGLALAFAIPMLTPIIVGALAAGGIVAGLTAFTITVLLGLCLIALGSWVVEVLRSDIPTLGKIFVLALAAVGLIAGLFSLKSAPGVSEPAPPSSGLRLVVGGGRAADYPPLKTGDIALNIAEDAAPAVRGDIANAPFTGGSFYEVFFENIPFNAISGKNAGAIAEAARLLQPGGKVVIQTGIQAPLQEILSNLQGAGFKNIEVTVEGFIRIVATR